VVLYELLAGRPPFTGDSPVAIAYKQVNEAPVPPSQRNPDIAPRLDAVVMKALAKNPANRYQTAQEMAEDLERVKQGQDVHATPLLPPAGDATQVIARPAATQVMPPPEPDTGARKTWMGVLIGVLIVAVLAGGGYLLATSLGNSNDPVTHPMPKVTGLQYADAKAQLEGLNLVVEKKTRATDAADPGTVLAQSQQPGADVEEGTTITLTVAKAIEKVEIPDLTGHTLDEAAAILTDLGLVLGNKTSTTSTTYDTGQIVDQSVTPGTLVDPKTIGPIDVTVVENAQTVTLDDYTCSSFGSAQAHLQQLGLTGIFAGTRPVLPECPNTSFVAFQDPAPGTEVAVGSQVLLYTGAEATTTPPPTSPPPSP